MILNRNRLAVSGAALLALLTTGAVQGAALAVPNSFSAGTPAVAAEVNANFNAVKSSVDDNDSRIAALESALAALQTTVSAQATTITSLESQLTTQATTISNQAASITSLESQLTAQATTISNQAASITSLESQVSAINASNVMALESYLTVDTLSDARGPLVQLAGVNLQVVNGQGSTATANGLGNLIVGYDEADSSGTGHCTIGWYSGARVPTDATNCTTVGGTWTSAGFKSGSHYLVTGSQNNYSRWGGLLTGYQNTSNYDFASVSGGYGNTASGPEASVSGGSRNVASGIFASASGGLGNTASGSYASITGGEGNTASARSASVTGGQYNTASGQFSSVVGGYSNTAGGVMSGVGGGTYNTASGFASHVSGGGNGSAAGANVAATSYSSILGSTNQTTTSVAQTIPALP